MKKPILSMIPLAVLAVMALTMYSCKEDPADPPTVTVFASVDGYQVAFTATVTNANSFSWDFDDGETSNEQNPVHVYDQSGSYTATITVTGEGGDASASTSVTIAASELEMLTGGPAMPEGKTWKISPSSSEGDGVFKCTSDLEFEDPIGDGILGIIGIPEEYQDEFTFKHDMTYTHDVKNDSAVTDIIYAFVNQIGFRPTAHELIVLAPFSPQQANFTYTEDTDLTLTCVDKDDDEVISDVTWSGVTVLEIAGGVEFIAIRDFTRKYMVLSISVDKMQIGVFASTSQGTYANYPKHMLVMTYIPKDL